MSGEAFRSEIRDLLNRLTEDNYKEAKQSLILLQQKISSAVDIDSAEKKELLEQISAIFDQIKTLQQKRQLEFETQAAQNFEFLREKVMTAIESVEENLTTPDVVWSQLLEVQQLFKGKKMFPEQREQLYTTLQKLFEIVKKRREELHKGKSKPAPPISDSGKFENDVAVALEMCNSENTEAAWDKLLEVKERLLKSKLSPIQKKNLIDRIQHGFDKLKDKRGFIQAEIHEQAIESAAFLKEKLEQAEKELINNPVFREKWDMLLGIQKEFKARKLEKETRNVLYDKLQALFLQLKTEQYKDQDDFEKQARENVEYLSPLVDDCMDLARHSKEFKKSKAYLIKVQSEFKGRRMKTADREQLYDQLQAAFTILNNRIAQYIDSQKDNIEIKAEGQISELETQVFNKEKEISKEKEKLAQLEAVKNDLEETQITPHKITDLQSQIEIVKASLRKKENELKELLEIINQLQKDKS